MCSISLSSLLPGSRFGFVNPNRAYLDHRHYDHRHTGSDLCQSEPSIYGRKPIYWFGFANPNRAYLDGNLICWFGFANPNQAYMGCYLATIAYCNEVAFSESRTLFIRCTGSTDSARRFSSKLRKIIRNRNV